MVFESIVVDVLNRFLGDYVENLNSNQLKLGIWGGDVVLENLILKQNALEELNVPVQTVYGRLGKLQLKIPWKNLYGASVEARVDRLFLIVNPIAEIKYDAEREAKMALESKRAELARIEEAKRKENEKDIKLDETFVEKLVTQIIKNVQLKITDIHIRYEDSVTNPNAPFSFGITLHNLSVHTTDENWKQAVLQQSVTKIFKILNLEGLALYWNPTTELYSKKGSDVITTKLESEIATKSSQPQDYAYALGPINATAKLKLNPKPEGDTPRFSVPKVILDLHMDSLDLKLTKAQYQDMLLLADSMDRMSRGAQYRKYRPDVKTYKGHYKEWWKFAYTCVLENEVRRRRKNWDWEHMMAHRLLCKEYATAYKCKLCSKNKTPPDAEKVIVEAEQKLDLFNLVVIRQRIEMEVEKILQLEAEERKREREQRGWFSWWYGSGGAKDEDNTEGVDFKKQFERAMTPEEKAKLFRAIDYQENSAPTHLPVEYEAVVMHYRLDKLQLTVTDKNLEVLKGIVDFVNLVIIQRPSANAMKVDAQMRAFTVQGVVQGDFLPQLVVSKDVTNDINLLNVTFEINPLDGSCDQRIKVLARPLQMVYDAQTVIEIVNLFKPPRDSSAMATLQVAAGNKLSDFKEMSALGMQYATSQHMYLDIDIDVAASYVIVPKHGIHKGDESCVVVKLGAINVKSEPREQGLDVRAMYDSGLAEEEIMRQLQLRSYDKMTLTLTHMQIVVATEGEDWQEAIASSEATGLHILQPTTLKIQIHKCLIADDPRLPKIKVRGELQKIAFSISEDRLLTLFEILMAMPLPQSETVHQLKMSSDKIAYVVTGEHVEQTVNDFATSESRGSNLSLFKYLDPAEKQKRDSSRSVKLSKLKLDEPAKQMTEVEAFFIMKELVIFINRNTKIYSEEHERFLKFSLYRLEVKAIQKTFTLFANVKLASVNMFHHRTGRKAISMIETPDVDVKNISQSDLPVVSVAEDDEQYLFSVTYYNVDKACPEFRSTYGSVEQKIKLQFTDLKITLHLEALQEILVVVNEYTTRAATLQKSNDRIADAGALDTIHEDEELVVGKAKVSAVGPSRSTKIESIQLKVDANLGTIQIEFATDARRLSLVTFEKAIAGLMVKQSYTQVDCAIGSVKVVDLNPVTIHREILKVLGGDIFNVKIVMYNLEQFPTVSNVNMSIDAQINCLRIVFLNWFVSSMLEFLNNFQTAQEAIIEASSQAADAARANVQSAYEDQSKVSLKVRLDAPIIIVPENSKSMNAVLVDLGWMNINNKFVDLNVEGKKVTVDDLILDLSDMKVVCMQMAEDSTSNATLSGQDEQERQILRPTSFKLYVKRSLSLWCDELPDLDISGRMKSISIQLGNGDYQSIMKILNQNLQEGETSKPTPAASKSSKQTNKKPKPDKKTSGVLKEPSNDTLKSQTVVQTVAQTTQAKKVKTTIKFAFTMDSFVIDVRSTVNIKGSTYTKDVDLARFGLALLSLKGRMYSDGSMNTSILLVDCTLDDTRPARGAKITRYLERRVSDANKDGTKEITKSPDKIRSMIDVTYTMKNSDTFIDIRIFSFNLILAMDFLLKLKDFLTTGLSYEPETKPVVKPAESAQKRHSTVISTRHSVSDTAPVTIEQGAIVEEQQQANPMMTVNIKIEQPDIILVESLEDKECDALVLNMLVRFKLRQTSEHMVADGGISDLQMVVRQLGFNDPSTPRYLLAPTTVSLALAQPPNSGMHVDIAVTDIKITISPEIMNLLNRVLATMTRNEEDDQDKEHKAVYYGMDLWGIQPLQPQEHWFLKTELAEEAINMDEAKDIKKTVVEGEICLLSSPSIVVALEIEIGKETVPVLVLQASLNGQVKDWSSELHLESTWAMQVSYYNISRAVWEPLVEPVEVLKDSQYKHVPWELKLEVLIRATDNNISIDTMDEAANAKAAAIRQARQTLTLSSNETFEVTLTRSALEMLTMLGNSFSTSVDLPDAATSSKSTADENYKKWKGAPYVLHNCTGLTTKLFLEANPDFCVFVTKISPINYKEVLLEPGASVPLQLKKAGMNLIRLNEPPPTLELKVHIVELNETIEIPVERADKRYFTVGRQLTGKVEKNVPHVAAMEPRGLISDVVMQDAALHIYLRSVVQSLCRLDSMEPLWSIWDLMMQDAKVTNFLDVNVSVYYMTLSGNEVRLLDEVAPGAKLRLPLQATHTPTAELFFSVEGFTVSVSPYIWRELQHEQNLSKLLTCESKDKNSGEKFYIRAVGETEQVYYENTNKHTFASSCYNIALKPAVKLQNCLPVAITVSQLGLERTQTFESGEMINLSHLAPYRASIVVMIQSYLDKCWVCTKNLPTEDIELSVWSFDSHDSPSIMTLDLGLHNINTEGTQVISLYCPFWMVNKTGLTLCYRKSKKPERETSSPRKNVDETGNVIFHPKTYKEPILFSFRAKNFFGKKKAALRVEFGDWSDKFSLDVPGSSGVVLCKNEGKTYQVTVTNKLTFNSLTKMVIFSPYFVLINEAPFDIQYQEMHRSGDPWTTVAQNKCEALWPIVENESKLLILRVARSCEITAPFLYTEQHSVCLKLSNQFGGLHVEVQVSEGGTYITVRQYREGHAPALLVNYSPHSVALYEKHNVNIKTLPPMHKMLFTWDNPAGPRFLIFEGDNNHESETDLRQDDIQDFTINSETVYWTSFLDGLQRVILLTDDHILASGAHTIGEAEQLDTEVVLSLQGMGLSLVNDYERVEILYMSVSNSGIIWEQCKLAQGCRNQPRYKKVEGAKLIQLEEAYQKYLNDKAFGESEDVEKSYVYMIDDRTEVNFEEMRQLKPNPRILKRTLNPGLWMSYGMSPHTLCIHARLNRLQIDQQLPLPTFPVILAPLPPPKSIANTGNGVKPFIELSVVERVMEHSKVRQYKYCKMLVQEFQVKIDMELVNAMMAMFPQRTLTEKEALEAFQLDLETARQDLDAMAKIGIATDQKNFYDNLHLSPLKVHLSFSLGGATQLPTFIGTILQSIGVTLTDMNDVVFKLAYYERNYEFLSNNEIMAQVQSHYTGQALKQLYVLVLGLDLLGNPYALVVGLKKGVEDLFYEPFQGAIQGPGEFAEGLFLGVRSLVGHTVGGAAGAVSRITGAMGHGLAALSLDKDYQRRRRDNINKPPANLQEGLARSGKGLVMGVFDGVTGVFTKPIEGAREQGVEGFFKGLGRGAVGLVARPTAGVVDFASGSLDAVKRAADTSEEVTKRRAARYFAPESGVRPYSRLQAEGYRMLSELEKGKFVTTDAYAAHVWVIPGKEAVMCTDKRLLYVERNSVFGGWQIVWSYLWKEIPEVPTAVQKGVYIPTTKKKVFGMFPSTGTGKVIFLYDEQQKRYLLAQCQQLMANAR